MISTSPSELVLADDCGRAHQYKYTRRLRLKDEKRSPTLASGVAVHETIELWCKDSPGEVPSSAALEVMARDALAHEFRNDYDGPTKNVKKFLPGVRRALARVPEWVWHEEWHTEEDVQGFFGVEGLDEAGVDFGPAVWLHGKPDMWRLVDDEAPTVQILDTKTTDYDPLDFLLWTPQLRMYAAMLKQQFPDRLISYQYMCLPTSTKDVPAPHSPPWLLTNAGAVPVEEEILMYAAKLGGTDPRYARRCSWCDFSSICKAIITGADPSGITEELYYVKERRND